MTKNIKKTSHNHTQSSTPHSSKQTRKHHKNIISPAESFVDVISKLSETQRRELGARHDDLKFPIQLRLILLFSFILLVVLVTFISFIILVNRRYYTNKLKQESMQLAAQFSQYIKTTHDDTTSIKSLINQHEIQSFMTHLSDITQFKNITLLNRHGHVLASVQTNLIGTIFQFERPGIIPLTKNQIAYPVHPHNAPKYHRMIIAFYRGTVQQPHNIIAAITFTVSQHEYTAFSQFLIRRALLLSAVLFLLSFFAITIIVQNSLRPLAKIVTFVRNIGRGVLHEGIHIDRKDEFGFLARKLNTMAYRLRKMRTEALNASPLSGLPGSRLLEKKLRAAIHRAKPFAVLYCDLDFFKAFNDYYGYERGDAALLLLADIIKSEVNKYGTKEDFIAHIGGDDFVILTFSDHPENICEHIIKRFDYEIIRLYDGKVLEQGYFFAPNRDGTIVKFSIMTLSIAVITNKHIEINHYGQISMLASEVKRKVKEKRGSNYMFNRRKETEYE